MTVHKSKLRTDFICIATSGYSVDGRQITSQELHEMAESYNPDFYTANLWPDHKRWINLGQVLELKAEDQENGETKLYAVITPSDYLINWNKQGQYLFTSVEIVPNFRNSEKCYLFGLGVTDQPASVGTTQLNFSLMPQEARESIISNHTQVNFSLRQDKLEQQTSSFFERLKEFFIHENQSKSSENNNNNEDKPMDKEQFSQLIEAVNQLGIKIDKAFSVQSKQEEPEPTETVEKIDTAVTAEQFNQLVQAVNNLDKKFSQMSAEVTQVPNGLPVNEAGKYSIDGNVFDLSKGI